MSTQPRFAKSKTPSCQPYPGLSDHSLYAPHAGKMFKKSSYCGGEIKHLGVDTDRQRSTDRPALARMRLFRSNKSHNGRPVETSED